MQNQEHQKTHKLLPNKEIGGGKYILQRNDTLGKGSFGQVYKCNPKGNSEVLYAVKVIDMKQLNQIEPELRDKQVRELEKEIQILQQVQSNYIVPLVDLTRSTNNLYLILKYCDGGDLSTYLGKQPNFRISEDLALRFLAQIVEGYKALLNLNIIHRDLKPANILLHQGNAHIADFGLGKISAINPAIQQDITVKGTPYYRAPQLLIDTSQYTENQYVKATNKCDIWSLGVMFYEMINGKKPWVAQNLQELQNTIYTQPLSLVVDHISEQSADLLCQMLQIEECDRISWQDLYRHPAIQYGQQYLQYNNNFNINQNIKNNINNDNDQNMYYNQDNTNNNINDGNTFYNYQQQYQYQQQQQQQQQDQYNEQQQYQQFQQQHQEKQQPQQIPPQQQY